jgi:hypothetical protein
LFLLITVYNQHTYLLTNLATAVNNTAATRAKQTIAMYNGDVFVMFSDDACCNANWLQEGGIHPSTHILSGQDPFWLLHDPWSQKHLSLHSAPKNPDSHAEKHTWIRHSIGS